MNPNWFNHLIGCDHPVENREFSLGGQPFIIRNNIPRSLKLVSNAQAQTRETFGFKWQQRDSFESMTSRNMMQKWANSRYGLVTNWFPPNDTKPLILDAGCGAAYTGLEYFRPVLDSIRYLGTDISEAVDVAATRMADVGADAAFLQCDLTQLPIPLGSLDAIFSEGVLHHTDSTEGAIKALAPLLKEGGLFLFYVYRRKGPIHEFVDDYIRERMQNMTPQEGWEAMMPLTKLGKVLGDLNIEVEIPEEIDLLDIPTGKINLQRLFYWHIAKAFYRPDYSLDEMNHINFDWYAPRNAHRQSPEEVRTWCKQAGLRIEREQVEEAGITVIARKV